MEYDKISLYLESVLLNSEKHIGKCINLETKYSVGLKNTEGYKKYNLPHSFFDVYAMANGMEIKWRYEGNPEYCGGLDFMTMKNFLSSNNVYDESDIEREDLLEFFYTFDMITPEAECGFIITPEETYKTIYYKSGQYVYRLELDFVGYITMLFHSKAYQNWPAIILSLINNEETEVIQDFKKCMIELDDNFSWENYIKIFNDLRLDK